MKIRTLTALCGAAGAAVLAVASAQACTRVVYLGPEGMVATGRTMDWREDPQTNLYLFPRGMERTGGKTADAVRWRSRYGSVIAAGYDIGTADGMNERGLVVNMLYLPESVYTQPDDKRPVMGMSIWGQYVLDNFATVDEAVAELSQERFRIDAPALPNGAASTLHMAISDSTGNSAILEYFDGRLSIHKGRRYRVLTNSPAYAQQLAVNDYWTSIGGSVMLPGTNRSSDRFARASYYVNAVTQSGDAKFALPALLSVLYNVSVPLGISVADKPYLSATRWRCIADQKNRVYFFDMALSPDTFYIPFAQLDFSPSAPVRKLTLTQGRSYSGNAAAAFEPAPPLPFLFGA